MNVMHGEGMGGGIDSGSLDLSHAGVYGTPKTCLLLLFLLPCLESTTPR